MAESLDIYKGHRPRAFVIVGGKPIMVENFDCTQTIRGEAGVANVRIPLDSIDSSVFADPDVINNIQEIEIWAGYLKDDEDEDDQLKNIFKAIEKRETQRFFTRRFSGYVLQPEWSFGTNGRYLNLSCIDWTGFLRDFKFNRELSGGSTEISAIVKMIQSDIIGLEIYVHPYAGKVFLGEVDNEENKVVYDPVGKAYWDILQEIAQKLSYVILVDHKKISLVPKKDNPLLWKLYYGPMSKQKDANGLPIGQYFTDLQIRFGAKGRIDKGNVVVEVIGVNHSKKGKEKAVRVIFGVTETKNGRRGNPRPLNPQDAPITTNTKYEKIVVSGNCTEQQARIVAENRYRELATRLVTGTVQLPFANHFMSLQDIITLVPDSSEPDMQFLKDYWFSVNSFNESFGISGYTQSVEFDSDPTIDNTPKSRIAPKKDKK